MSFSDKLIGKSDKTESIYYVCDTCSKCKIKYFINLDIDGENKYICSYLCSKNLHEKYGKNYWDKLVNIEDFNKYPTPPIYNNINNYDKFSIKISPEVGVINPNIIPIVVVLPHPLGPKRPTVLFFSLKKLISFTAK